MGYEGRRVMGIGRPHKVDRQEMVGAVAAVKHWMTINHEERLANIEVVCQTMMGHLKSIPGVDVVMMDNIIGHQPFGLEVHIDASVTGVTSQELVIKLKEGDPPIWTRVREGEDFIILHAFGLSEGQDNIVGERIAELLL